MENVIFSRRLASGKEIVCKLEEICGYMQSIIYVDGVKVQQSGSIEYVADMRKIPAAKEMVKALEASGCDAVWGRKVGLMPGEAKKINQAIKNHKEEKEKSLRLNVPGIEELQEAYRDVERHKREMQRMFSDERFCGKAPDAVKFDVAALESAYPRAAVYLLADDYSGASHWAKSTAGKKAKEILASGGSIEDAKNILENWNA